MHWGIRRYQPYPSDYHGDGRYIGDTPSIRRTNTETSGISLKKSTSVDDPNSTAYNSKVQTSIRSHIERIKYQINRGLDKIGVSNKHRYTETGSMFMKSRDKEFEEVQCRYYSDGSYNFFPPAKVLKDFTNIGKTDPAYWKNESQLEQSKGRSGIDYDAMQCNLPNTKWGEDTRGRTQNCTKCSATMELRRRGFNVRAGRSFEGSNYGAIGYWFDGTEYQTATKETFADKIKSFGKGARGSMATSFFGTNSGHAINWEVDDSGDVVLSDGQSGKTYTANEYLNSGLFNWNDKVEFFRLDTASINYDHLIEDSVIAAPYETETYVREKRTKNLFNNY